MKKILFSLSVGFSLFASQSIFAQSHGHFYVGATGKDQGAQLVITNAGDFITNSDYVLTLTYTNGGVYAGYFNGNITYEALAATNALGDPTIGGPALGSWIHGQIASVDGPAGGVFSFWDVGATSPTINVPCGTTSTNTLYASNNNNVPGSDPFGHVHGRRFSATKPGIYLVNFRALDLSTNGAGGGPIHTPSELLPVYVQAGINIQSISQTNGVHSLRFGSVLNKTFTLEATGNLTDTNSWQQVSEPVLGTDYFLSVTETNSVPGLRFYRLRAAP
ncbi:MAG: hypothetical protein ABJC04_03870 [Verrucomicrobiota bacterium]